MKPQDALVLLLMLFVLTLLVSGAPLAHFFGMGLMLSGIVALFSFAIGARKIAARASVGALACLTGLVVWPMLTRSAQRTIQDPRVEQAVHLFAGALVVLLVVLCVLGVLGLIAKMRVARPKVEKLPKPSLRRRADIMEPVEEHPPSRQLPSHQQAQDVVEVPAGDELNLFGSGEEFRI